MTMILAAVAATAMVAPPAPASDPPPVIALAPSASEAAAVVDRFHHALKASDLAGASALLDEAALIYESGGVERSKAEYEAHHLPADAAFSKSVPSLLTRRSGDASGSFAWVATESRTTGSFNGQRVNRVATETMVLRLDRGAWKIIHIHWSSGAASR